MSKTPLTPEELATLRSLHAAATKDTLYAVLGLRTNAAPADVESAWLAFARTWHPDRFYSRDTGDMKAVLEEVFAAASRAYRTLSDAQKRVAYDKELLAQGRFVAAGPSAAAARASGAAGPTAPTRGPAMGAPAAVAKFHQQAMERVTRARACVEDARREMREGRWGKAESALQLALSFDPGSPEAANLLKEVSGHARMQRAEAWIAQAQSEEESGRVREALALYKKAADTDAPPAAVLVRLGKLLLQLEEDTRGAVNAFRKAVQKEPRLVDARLSLADAYVRVGLGANARREVDAVLAQDPKNDAAKALLKRIK
jgi:curved DNA-binding protein CbpA